MVVVDVQVDAPATQLAKVRHVVGPVGRRDDASEVSGQQATVLTRFGQPADVGELGKERQHMGHHQQPVGLGCSSDHPASGIQIDGDRLFHQHVLPCSQGFQHDLFVLVGWQADVDQVDVRI